MKKMVLFLVALVSITFTASADAGHRPLSELIIKTPLHSNYIVLVDGIKYFGNAHFNIIGLTPGQHHVEIIENRRTGRYGNVRTIHNGFVQVPRFSRVVAQLNNYCGLDIIRVINIMPPRQYQASCAYTPDRPQHYYDTHRHTHPAHARKSVNRRR